MSTSKTYQQSLADAGSETRPPMLERGSYIPWASRFRRYINRKRENRKWLNKALDEGPYQFEMFIPNNSTVPKLQTAEDLQGDALLHYDAEMELMNLILLSIPNDIYNFVDACTSAKDMWKRVERLKTDGKICVQGKLRKAMRNVRLEDAQEVPLNDSITPADEGSQMKEKSDSGDVENASVKGSLSRNNVRVNVVNIGVDSGNEGPNKGLMKFGTDSSDSHNTSLVSPTLNTPSFADVLKDAGNSDVDQQVNIRSKEIRANKKADGNEYCATGFGLHAESVNRNDGPVGGMDQVIERGPWIIRNTPLILNRWPPNVSLKCDEVTKVPVWVKLYNVPLVAYLEDRLSLIDTQVGKPIMLDAFTSSMRADSWGRICFARALIEVNAELMRLSSACESVRADAVMKGCDAVTKWVVTVSCRTGDAVSRLCEHKSSRVLESELKKEVSMAILVEDEIGYTREVIRVEYEWKPPHCVECKIFGHGTLQCPKRAKEEVSNAPPKATTKPCSMVDQDEGFVEVKSQKTKGKKVDASRSIGATSTLGNSKKGDKGDVAPQPTKDKVNSYRKDDVNVIDLKNSFDKLMEEDKVLDKCIKDYDVGSSIDVEGNDKEEQFKAAKEASTSKSKSSTLDLEDESDEDESDEDEVCMPNVMPGGGFLDDLDCYDGYEAHVYDLPKQVQAFCDRYNICMNSRVRK
ncbi:integrase, catalytic region, zinc finger, CCHC-type containing protein [Tanacetum coccineum]|uniref:Integrase, catalytic region, zinc finger, CCHC-type containing protein n=1 Tax=Tanacetum coccineum TaxID=301880 RepID=A0ABQ4YHB5_9ASTR